MSFDTAIAGSGIVALSISGDAAAPLFTAADKQLEAVQKELDGGNPHVAGFAIPDLQLRLNAQIVREQQTGNNVVGYLPATTATTGGEQAVDRRRRALRSPRPRRRGQLARRQGGRQPDSPWRRRQRVRHGDRAEHRRRAGEAAAQAQSAARVLVGRRARPARIERVCHQAADAARPDRGVSQFRHGRPRRRQQADGAGHRHERDVAEAARAGERRGRIRPDAAGGSVSADRRRQLQHRQRRVPDLLHRRAPGVPQAERHRRQDQLRRSRSRRRVRDRRSSSG